MKNDRIKSVISATLFIFFIICSYLFASKHPIDISDIKNISIYSSVICLVILLLGLLVRGLATKLILKSFDVSISLNECFGLTVITGWGNYIFPFGGFGARAAYLKNIHKLPYSHFLSTMMATYIIQFFALSTLGLISLAVISDQYNLFNINILSFLLITLTVSIIFILFNSRMPLHKTSLIRHITKMINGWQRIKETRGLTLKLFIISTIRICLFALLIYFSFAAYDYQISLMQSLLIASLTGFSVMVRITPGSFGFQEGMIIFAAKFLEFPTYKGILVAGLVRLICLICFFSLGPIYSYFLLKNNVKIHAK